jgi:putative hydrolase of the HAD superfamily
MNKENVLMKYDAVLFDLGNTLVSYYSREQWPAVLAESIERCGNYLRGVGAAFDENGLDQRILLERGEPSDLRVNPLAGRLRRIFQLGFGQVNIAKLCRVFMEPTFERARRYDDVLTTLAELKQRGYKTGILSNSPWGSPAKLWHEELHRLELEEAVDTAVFCCETGYRKPAPQAFDFITERLNTAANRCLFVGDDPRWDLAGPHRVGMDAILIDRTGGVPDQDGRRVLSDLTPLWEILQ